MAKRKHWTTTSLYAPDYGEYEPTKEERFALYWCTDNKIIIYADHNEGEQWHINIKIDKKIHKSPEKYGKDEVIKKIFEFYLYYANKYRPKDEL